VTTLSELRSGLATRLQTVTGLASTAEVVGNALPPYAMVLPGSPAIEFDESFADDGIDQYRFTVRVIVGRVDEQGGQKLLDAYLSKTGTSSIRTALRGDRTLGGKASDLRVQQVSNYGAFVINDVSYLGAEFSVQVFA
jgi:hypothetical protein